MKGGEEGGRGERGKGRGEEEKGEGKRGGERRKEREENSI